MGRRLNPEPSLWWEAHSRGSVYAAETHVIAIGVSRYRHLPDGAEPRRYAEAYDLGQLESAALSAFNVANWFRTEHRNPAAPLATIRLLLSPSPAEEAGMESVGGVPAADRQQAIAALEAWREDCNRNSGSVGVLFASGHGILVDGETPVILLEDFASEPRIFDIALDVGAVQKSMSGIAAHAQLFFADACQLPSPPRIDQGHGKLLVDPRSIEQRRSAPIYYSCSPGKKAYGHRGRGSLFSEALITCLRLRAAQRINQRWQITTTNLQEKLIREVERLARLDGVTQSVRAGGMMGEAIVHELERTPEVPIKVLLQPPAAVGFSHATLLDSYSQPLLDDIKFEPNPFEDHREPGIYGMKVSPINGRDHRSSFPRFWAADVPDGINEEVWMG